MSTFTKIFSDLLLRLTPGDSRAIDDLGIHLLEASWVAMPGHQAARTEP